LILSRLTALGWPQIPAVLCGDFNAGPTSREHALLLQAGFRDTWIDCGHPDAATFHGFRGAAAVGEDRIDWILSSGALRPLRVTLIRDAQPPRYPSDHYPVMADLGWNSDGPA
jgi:endonuclease/exonuclease/phosphatase family metal-dependent hydrolase